MDSSRKAREARIRTLAGRQFGRVARWQLRQLGMPAGTIDARVHSGALVALHEAVYEYGPPRHDALAQAIAAQLAGGSAAVVSHSSAAHLWGLEIAWRLPVHVTLTRGQRRTPGVAVHRSRSLGSRDIRTHRGIRTTSPARTALDLAPLLADRKRTRLVNDLLRRKLMSPDHLRDVIGRNPRHPGSKLLRPSIEDPTGATASALEDLFVELCRRHGLPTPRLNATVDGREVDALFESQKVIVELDSWQFHGDRAAFGNDRERDLVHLTSGFVTVRLTHQNLTAGAGRAAARLHAILRSRS
jgi:very-short-patch-repair endonuclease